MKFKKEYLILGVIIIALSVYLILHNRDRRTYEVPKLPPVAHTDITRIEIVKGDAAGIELSKEGSDWKILPQVYPADNAKIKDMLNVISRMTLTALVSESKNYGIYDLDEDRRVRVKAWAKDNLVRSFDAGKAAASFRHTFVKLPEDPMVYHAQDNFRRKFDLSVDDLRDKEVLSFETEMIHEVVIEKGDQVSTFSKQAVTDTQTEPDPSAEAEMAGDAAQAVWVNEHNEPADPTAIQQLLSTLSDLKCDKFLEEKTKESLTGPIYTIHLNGAKAYSLSLYEKLSENDTQVPAVSSNTPYLFLLPQWRVENIMKDPADMLKKE